MWMTLRFCRSIHWSVDVWIVCCLFAVMGNAAVNSCVHAFERTCVACLSVNPGNGVAGVLGNCMLNPGGPAVFKAAAAFCIPTSRVGGFRPLHLSASTCPWGVQPSSGREVEPHGGFALRFPDGS